MAPTAARSATEEAKFMEELMQGLDDIEDFWNVTPSSPVKATKPATPTKSKNAHSSKKAVTPSIASFFTSSATSTPSSSSVKPANTIKHRPQTNPISRSQSTAPAKPTPQSYPRVKPQLSPRPSQSIRQAKKEPSPEPKLAPAIDLTAFLEGSEHWDLNFEDDLLSSPVKSKSPVKKERAKTAIPVEPAYTPESCTRCIAESIEDEFVNHRWRKVIVARIDFRRDLNQDSTSGSKSGSTNEERAVVYLCDDWYQTDVRIDDVFNIIGSFDSSSPTKLRSIHITSQINLFILHPDLLITATALSNAPQCRRKPVLGMLLKTISSGTSATALNNLDVLSSSSDIGKGARKKITDITPSLVWGNMLHEVTQKCLTERDGALWNDSDENWDKFMDRCIEEAVNAGLTELVKLGGWEGYAGFSGDGNGTMAMTEEIAKREVKERAKGLGMFRQRYLGGEVPKIQGTVANTRSKYNETPARLAITRVIDVEEDIWSPRYGLKGKIDATVMGVVQEPSFSSSISENRNSISKSDPSISPVSRASPYPLELKTGRPSVAMEHRAQTMLYTLLLSERYGTDVQDGLLFYTQGEAGEVVRVPRGKNEIRALVGVRNEVAAWAWRRVRKIKESEGHDVEVKCEKSEDSVKIEAVEVKIEEEEVKVKMEVNEHVDDVIKNIEREEPFLPPPIDDERECKRCYALDTCLLFRKTYPNHTSACSSLSEETYDPPLPSFLTTPITVSSQSLFQLKTGHLTQKHVEFFKKWERMLSLEEMDLVRYKRELWTLGAEEREKRGRCWSWMRLVQEEEESRRMPLDTDADALIEDDDLEDAKWGKEGKIHRFTYSFKKAVLPSNQTILNRSGNLLNGHMSVGDAITVSVQGEPRMLALARGFIVDLTKEKVVLGVDHVLDVGAIRERMGQGDLRRTIDEGSTEGREVEGDGVVFRIDKDELFGGMARVRNNLAQMFYADGDRKRLQLVVDLRKPVFRDLEGDHEEIKVKLEEEDTDVAMDVDTSSTTSETDLQLNPTQHLALRKALSAEDYALILGMPGTGKTTVIAALIKELVVKRGKTVLLTSYTHSAVDTILRKLEGVGVPVGDSHLERQSVKEEGGTDEMGTFKILRLGNVDKVHPEVRKYTLAVSEDEGRKQPRTVHELEEQLMQAPVVATTCLSIDHALFSRRTFDYCIVDEASQITLPTCLGPLRFAEAFILVGDHHQLPPLVKNPRARALGLDTSLFRILSTAHPEAMVDLREQYRMNEDIMTLSNRLIYSERLRCGSEEVRTRVLKLERRQDLERAHDQRVCGDPAKDKCWLMHLASESCKAVFVDTDNIPDAHESRVGDLVQNVVEAELVSQFVKTLRGGGVKPENIGVISLYRQQVKLLEALINGRDDGLRVKKEEEEEKGNVEIWTADKSQGRDKDCVVVSLVRSNETGSIGDLIKDWRRINVSFTRARSKLVIFGSRKTLEREPLLREFFDLMESKKWILKLDAGAVHAHNKLFGLESYSTTTMVEEGAPKVKMEEVEIKIETEKDDTDLTTKIVEKRKLGKENAMELPSLKVHKDVNNRPVKKMRVDAGAALLKGRPVLKDLVEHDMC